MELELSARVNGLRNAWLVVRDGLLLLLLLLLLQLLLRSL
jgi:hypothetical protein